MVDIYDRIAAEDVHNTATTSIDVAIQTGGWINKINPANGNIGAIEYPKILMCCNNVDLVNALMTKWLNTAGIVQMI